MAKQQKSTDDEGASPSNSNSNPDELSERLNQLRKKLDGSAAEKKAAEAEDSRHSSNKDRSGIGQALRLSSEFIAGVVVGAGIGYGVDTFFGTSPWGMIVFLLLGFVAAVLNVMRAAGLVAESKMRLKPAHDLQNEQLDDDSGQEVKK